MLDFKKLKLSDVDTLLPYFLISKKRICDDTIGGTFMWRDFFSTEYAIIDDTLCLKMKYLQGRTAFSMPLGKNVLGALDQIYQYCAANNIPMIVCTVTDAGVSLIKEHFDAEETKERNWSDYLYLVTDLALMSGRKYNTQRNHVNSFKREYPNYCFKEIDKNNINDVISFFEVYRLQYYKDDPVYIEESAKVLEVLKNYTVYKQFGTVLYVSDDYVYDNIVAFSIGEIVGDTVFVHIEKANINIRGSYQMIVKEFAAQNMAKGVQYINREEDVGDMGLRKSKISYHPFSMIDKYTVEIHHVK